MNNNADTFEQWTVRRSFATVKMVSKLTLLILLPFLVVADPFFFINGYWTKNPQFFYLTLWHVVLAMGYLGLLIATKFIHSCNAQARVLTAFLVFSSLIFSWFGLISWFITGDFSAYGISMICMAALFTIPGPLRRILYVVTAVGMAIMIAIMDKQGKFLENAIYLNLVVTVLVAFAVDHHMMKNSRRDFNNLRGVSLDKI